MSNKALNDGSIAGKTPSVGIFTKKPRHYLKI